MKITIFEKIPSTNEYCEERDFNEDTAIIAREQTGGKGTKGRSFASPKGGAYLSLVRLYPCKANEAFSIMVASCMAVVKTLDFYGVKADIKWPNDVYVGGRKICGILIKNSLEGDMVKKSVTGVGVNVNADIPAELKDIAINLKSLVGEVDLDEFCRRLIENLYGKYSVEEYRRLNIVLNKEITVIENLPSERTNNAANNDDGGSEAAADGANSREKERVYKAVAETVANDGSLVLKNGKRLFCGEVTIRL